MTATLAGRQATTGVLSFSALGTTATLLTADGDPDRLAAARAALEAELAAVDVACSRFRADSELTRVNRAAGQRVTVSPRLSRVIAVALRAARLTGGLVDPTVGAQLCALGYDRTFAALDPCAPAVTMAPAPAPGWQEIDFDPSARTLRVPPGTSLDLGATAKALAADAAAARCARATGRGVLVNLGGDLAVAGPAPAGGWRVRVSDDHRQARGPGATVTLAGGALATSGTTVRAWRRGGRAVHHIVDPATGANPPPCWRTVSITAATCIDANTASTAAVIMGPGAPRWLDSLGLPARLVAVDGTVTRVAGWPQPAAEADGAMP